MLKRERRKYITPNTRTFWYLMDEELASDINIPVGSAGQRDEDDSEKVKAWNDDLGGAWDEDITTSGSSDVWDKAW